MSGRAPVLLLTLSLVGVGCGGEEETTGQIPDPVDEFVSMQVFLLMWGSTLSPAIHCVGKLPTECCRFKVGAPARYGRCDVDAALRCGPINRTRFTMERFHHKQDAEGPFRLSGDLTLESAASWGLPGKTELKTEIRGTLSVYRDDSLVRAGRYDLTARLTMPSLMETRNCVQGLAFGAVVNGCTSYGVGSL